ncbi:MAG: hypothetical protein EHM61_04080 [Acidobacteria bacterium]|nr:MAG: hypothetical protein EHM61_04080 [Acidobacteriota bacterium]
MKSFSPGVALVACLFFVTGLLAQSSSFFPLEQVKPGLKGYGKTTFEGNQVERFEFEILGVLKNVGAKQDMILARLAGPKLDRTGVFAGMSGSPVYIDDKLVGAVAAAFPFSKEPIAGITPIQQMVDIFKERPATSAPSVVHADPRQWLKASTHLADLLPGSWAVASTGNGLGNASSLRRIATPLNLSGFSPQVIEQFAPQFRALGLEPVSGIGGMAADPTDDGRLEPGSTVAVQLVRGDMDVSATGTVTHVSGNSVYAFGHPFLSIGYTDLPMSKAAVITVIPTLMVSMKVAATTQSVGTIRQDRATGIMGVTGEKSKMIPVHLKVNTSRNEIIEYDYEVVNDTFLTPFLMAFTVQNGIVASERAIGGQTLQLKCSITVKDQPEIVFENSVSDLASSTTFAALAAASPVHFLLNSGFENLVMEKMNIEISAIEQTREAILEKVWHDKLEARPGEEVNLTVFLRKPNGELMAEKYPIKIPEDIAPGPLKLMVGDGTSFEKNDADSELEFVPTSLQQLVRAINNLKKNDRLYIRLYRDQPGALIGGEALPDLPPSLLALYRSEKTSGDVKTINKVIYVEHELSPTKFVLNGQKVITINIKS